MKKAFLLFPRLACSLVAAGLAMGLPASAYAQNVGLVTGGRASAKIYVSPDDMKPTEVTVGKKTTTEPSATNKTIDDLVYHLEKMSGAKLDVVQEKDPKKVPKPALVVGSLAAELGGPLPKTKWNESYRIVTKDGRVLIYGETLNGATYGSYAFLNDLGCDWVLPGAVGEVIPATQTVSIPQTDKTSAPAFGLRWMWLNGGTIYTPADRRVEFDQWLRRQRFGGKEELLPRLKEAHMWQIIAEGKEYTDVIAQHPEYLALVTQPDGTQKRVPPQLETANPAVIDLLADYVRKKFEKNGWPKDYAGHVPLGPADGLNFSESPESIVISGTREDPVIGGRDTTNLLVKAVNDVLVKLGDEYPNVTLGYLVYGIHGSYPELHKPHPRSTQMFAPIAYSRYHSTIDPKSKTRAYYRQIVEEWAKLGKEQGNSLTFYEYNWNLAENIAAVTRIRTMAEDLKFYHDMGFMGFTIESIEAWSVNAPHNFLTGKMGWDTSLDWKNVLSDYCKKAYGVAAPEMEKYYLRLIEQQHAAGQEAGSYFSLPLMFGPDYLKAAQADLDAAQAKKGVTPVELIRIKAVADGFKNLTGYIAWNNAMNSFNFAEAQKQIDGLLANFEAMKATNPAMVSYAGGRYIDRLMARSGSAALQYSSAPNKIIYKLPEELPTLLDPLSEGDKANLFAVNVDDSKWIRTHTYSSTWDAQGLTFFREGSVWYRTRFPVAADLKSQHIGLLLSAFEDEARIWVNGKSIGSSGIKYPRPFAVDITPAIEFGKENVLTIQVKRNSMANELAIGGILRPGFIFAGPKVEPEKAPEPKQRVLPGGGLEAVKPGAKPSPSPAKRP